MHRRFIPCLHAGTTMLLALLAGCVTSTSRRGEVEFGRMRLLNRVDEAPRPAMAPEVRYPEVLLAQGVEGSAEMRFVVDDLGVTRDITVVAASAPEFGEAAEQGIRRLRYVPAVAGGRRVACGIEITLFFRQY
jgi:TonB family protein